MPSVTLTDFDPFDGAPPPLVVPRLPTTAPSIPQMQRPAGDYIALSFVEEMRQCTACACRREASQVVPGIGPTTSPLLIIGQNPGAEEDRSGVPFIGEGGEELNRWLKVLGIDRRKTVITNAAKCHTTNNRLPLTSELKICVNLWLAKELQELAALRIIVPVGKPAVAAVLGKSAPPMIPLMAHHFRVRVAQRELSVFPLPHPAFLLRARHYASLFQTVLTHVRLTLLQEFPEVMEALK